MRNRTKTTAIAAILVALASANAPAFAQTEAQAETTEDTGKWPFDNPYLAGLNLDGAIRAQYVIGDYGAKTGQPSRAWKDYGRFEFDTFFLGLSYKLDAFSAYVQYRFQGGYQFFKFAYLAYEIADAGKVSAGIVNVPFGATDAGVALSFFFDMNYYVGLADDKDLGVLWEGKAGALSYDVGYYLSSEFAGRGSTSDSARYGYDIVDETANETYYNEAHQVNARAIYTIDTGSMKAALGASFVFGLINSNGPQDDGSHYAAAVHGVVNLDQLRIAVQGTYYKFDIGDGNNEITLGAYEAPQQVATEGIIPAISLSYEYKPGLSWVDTITPFLEFSSLIKTESDWNPTHLLAAGILWGHDGWYVYSEYLYANGHPFIGSVGADVMTANVANEWHSRINIDFGYYF